MYQEIILDHYRSPHGAGLREPFDAESFQINPTCGDEITLRVALDGDTVRDVSHETLGCSISQASASVLTDLVVGRSVADSLTVLAAFQEMAQGRGQVEPDEDVLGDGVAFAGVARYPARVKCALLGWMAFKDAVSRGVTAGDPGPGGQSPGCRVREYSEGERMSVEHSTGVEEEVVRGAAGMPEPPAAPAAGTAADLDDLEEAMRDVVDPELGINVVDLGLVYGIAVDSRVATIDMTLTSAACPLTDVIEDQARAALVSGGLVDDIRINWVWMPPWGPEKITEDGREQLRALGFRV